MCLYVCLTLFCRQRKESKGKRGRERTRVYELKCVRASGIITSYAISITDDNVIIILSGDEYPSPNYYRWKNNYARIMQIIYRYRVF